MSRPLALITGASSGIGAAFARQLAAGGYDLVLVARRTDRIEALARELSSRHGINAEALTADLAGDAGVDAVVRRIEDAAGLELLINNAGFGTSGGFFLADIQGQEAMHRLHVLATMRLTHAALRQMVPRKRGGVINVSSVAGFLLSAGSTSYCSTKAWMNRFSEGIRLELRAMGSPVRVQALCPGYTRSEFHAKIRMDISRVPKGWWMEADDVVRASLKGLQQDRLYVIPGWRYQLLVALMSVLPRGLRQAAALWNARRQGRF